jgi:hypothetical protein
MVSLCIYPEFSIPVNEAGVERIVFECIVNNDGKGMRKLGRIEEARRITETAAGENSRERGRQLNGKRIQILLPSA